MRVDAEYAIGPCFIANQFHLQEERGTFIVEEIMPWNTSLKLFSNVLAWHSNPYTYYVEQCERFYANQSVIDWIRAQHYDLAVVDLIQGGGGPSGLDPIMITQKYKPY